MLEEKFMVAQSIFPFMLQGLWMTFKVSSLAILLGSMLGFVLGVIRSLREPIGTNLIGEQ